MRRSIWMGAVVAALVAVPAAPAAAADNTFSGKCEEIEGSATFDQPLTATEADNGYHFTGTGLCSGTLNGASITDAPIAAQVDGKFHGSCSGSESTAPGPGKLVFTKGTPTVADDVTVTFTMTFTGVASEIDFLLTGTKSGTATGQATFLTTRTPPDLVVKCETGGNSELPFDASSDEGSLTSASDAPAAQPATSPTTVTTTGTQTTPTTQPGATAPLEGVALELPSQRWSGVLRSGLRATCRAAGPATCVVKVRLAKRVARKLKLSGAIARGSGAAGSEVVARITARARRKLRRMKSVTVIVTATVAGRQATRTVALRR